jgi:hypothetical protein
MCIIFLIDFSYGIGREWYIGNPNTSSLFQILSKISNKNKNIPIDIYDV